MKKIFGLGIAALLIIGLVGGGTWAYFSDIESSTGNTLVAGTLDLGVSNTDAMATGSTNSTWSQSNWKPGAPKDATLYISNSGSLDMANLYVSFNYTSVNISGRPSTITGSPWTTDPTDLFDKMIYASTATWNGTSVPAIAGKTLAELKAANNITLTALGAGLKAPLNVIFTFNTTATNGCQANSVDVTVTATGTQN